MQAITGNPMASPFTTGLSSAAAFGAALMILFGGFPLWMQKGATVAAAFAMSVICAIVVYTSGELQTAPSGSIGTDRHCFKLSV